MTLSVQSSRNDYTGNNCTLVYAYTFKIPTTSDIDVFVAGVQKTLTTDYAVSGANEDTGGSVTFVTAPGCTLAVALVRDVPYTQLTDYPENSAFPAAAHEDALDKLTMLAQQIKDLATRSWRFAAGSVRAASGYVVDEPAGGKYPRVKSDCSGIEFVGLESCGTYANPVTTKGDLIQGSETGVQERLAISATIGDQLRVSGTGKASWAGPGIILTNKLDAQADAGKLFALSTTCDKAFLAADARGCTQVYVAANEIIGDDCQGSVAYSTGPVRVPSIGPVARGDYLIKAAAPPGAVQAACTRANMVQYRPVPRGALGVALSAASGDCVDMLVFSHAANGAQGLATVRGNKSQSNMSTANSQCTKTDMLADALVLRDACNDVVVVTAPASITNDLTVDSTNQDNGRDQFGSFSAGDLHFYWVYEATAERLKTRSSQVAPCDRSGPTLPSCETHFAYSHSATWNANCLLRHSVRGHGVFYECAIYVLAAGSATCTTRVSLVTAVPLAATRVRLLINVIDTGTTSTQRLLLGTRLNCLSYNLIVMPPATVVSMSPALEITIPNINQELYYRFVKSAVTPTLDVSVISYDVPNGDS